MLSPYLLSVAGAIIGCQTIKHLSKCKYIALVSIHGRVLYLECMVRATAAALCTGRTSLHNRCMATEHATGNVKGFSCLSFLGAALAIALSAS